MSPQLCIKLTPDARKLRELSDPLNVRTASRRLMNAQSARPSAIRILFTRSRSSWISHLQSALTKHRQSQTGAQLALRPSACSGDLIACFERSACDASGLNRAGRFIISSSISARGKNLPQIVQADIRRERLMSAVVQPPPGHIARFKSE